jgi:hypothetical protein
VSETEEPGDSPYEDAQEQGYEGEQRVDNDDAQTATGQFEPHLIDLDPHEGAAGDAVRIVGNGLVTVTSVTFGGVEAEFTVDGDVAINATVPEGSGTVDVAVTNPNGSTDLGDAFTYGSDPAA